MPENTQARTLAIGTLALELRELEAAHQAGKVDPGPHLRAIERRIAAAESKLDRGTQTDPGLKATPL